MSTISSQDIERNPVAFLKRVEAGEAFVIIRGGHPMAEIRPLAREGQQKRSYGLAAGQITVADDFDAPLSGELLKQFEGA
jgi:antitoxin (DNA-binding transcriptional repressor) of toxin-antitoxin stability system